MLIVFVPADSANEKGIKLDAQTALDYILSHPTLENTKYAWLLLPSRLILLRMRVY